MFVSELMTRKIEWTAPTTTLADAARRMRDRNIGCLPVGNDSSFVGILTEKDITTRATAESMDPSTTTVGEIMTRGVVYCQDNDSIEDAIHTMQARQIHHLPVRNSSNMVVGIVSLSDLALKGPSELYSDVSRLAFQNSSLTNATRSGLAT
ncbi:MAG TPA: CBS domain-containing protein [Acetobacteraceae bacterium]|nr:CBS domain-containing protein [Acetobacteraceae bacterium]